MKFYVASSLKNVKAARRLIKEIKKLGHTITFDWTTCLGEEALKAIGRVSLAHAEIRGVKEAEAVVWLCPTGRGSHVELGIALASSKGKRIYLIGAPVDDCIFYDAMECLRWSSLRGFLRALRALDRSGYRATTIGDLPKSEKEHRRRLGYAV